MLNVEKIYVLHYTKLIERKNNLDAYFASQGIEVEYITEYDQEDLSEEMILASYECNQQSYESRIRPAYGDRYAPFRELNIAEISCTFKHREAIKRIAQECDNYGLILEDDVMFCENFPVTFNTFLQNTPKSWEAIFMGCCAGLHVPQHRLIQGINAYRMDHPASRGGDSYMLTKDAARKISETMEKFVTISDWELAYQIYRHDIETYWWEPSVIKQGSETGLYRSTLR